MAEKPWGVAIHADGTMDEIAQPQGVDGELEVLQSIVSRGAMPAHHYVEVSYLALGAAGFSNEEGLYAGPGGGPLPLNQAATDLLRDNGDDRNVIVGSMVVVGQPDDQGNTTSIPEAMYRNLVNRRSGHAA